MVYDGSKLLTVGIEVTNKEEGKARVNCWLELKTIWIYV